MNRNALIVFLILVVTAMTAAWMLADSASTGEAGHDHGEHATRVDEHGQDAHHGADAHDDPRGPHGGRLLEVDDFAIEITIFEQGIPPEFRVYAYHDGKPVPPEQVTLAIELVRLGGRIDRIGFKPQLDYLRGDTEVVEPHSFDVTVTAGYGSENHHWSYESHEGRTRIPQDIASVSGIRTEIAGPASIRNILKLNGQVQIDPGRLSRVRARFPGVVRKVHRNLGDVVKANDILATVQSNESLENYTLKSPIGGLIVGRDIQVGEATGEEPLFIITDLSVVWVELDVFGRDLNKVLAGQSVEVETFDGYRVAGSIDWISPLSAHASQSVRARVRLDNAEGRLRPGQFVRGRVTIADHEVPLALRLSALQRFRDFEVIFARVGDVYEVRMPETGRRDSEWVEVLGGIEPGTEYVTENSYLIKADIEKSGASHDH